MKHTNKFCTLCDTNKPVEDWYNDKSKIDGLDVVCKVCRKQQNKTTNPKHNPKRMYVNSKYIPKTHPLYKPGRYKTFEGAAFASLSNYETSTEGYKLEYKKQFNHRRIAESQAHKLCGKKALQQNGEWFKININDAINLIESITEEQNERETA